MSAHVDTVCAACGIEFCMPAHLDASLRESGKSFYCPNGHRLSYKEGPKDLRIRELERDLTRRDELIERWADRHSETMAQREEMIGALKECPFGCGFRSRRQVPRDATAMGRGIERVLTDLREHLQDAHGARIPAQRLIPERTGTAAHDGDRA